MPLVSLSLEDKMNDFIETRCKELGLRSRGVYIRRLLADDMDKQSERERPVINYFGAGTRMASDMPLPSVADSMKTREATGVISTNSEFKAALKKAGGDPRKMLRKVSQAELDKDARRPSLTE